MDISEKHKGKVLTLRDLIGDCVEYYVLIGAYPEKIIMSKDQYIELNYIIPSKGFVESFKCIPVEVKAE